MSTASYSTVRSRYGLSSAPACALEENNYHLVTTDPLSQTRGAEPIDHNHRDQKPSEDRHLYSDYQEKDIDITSRKEEEE